MSVLRKEFLDWLVCLEKWGKRKGGKRVVGIERKRWQRRGERRVNMSKVKEEMSINEYIETREESITAENNLLNV